MKFTENMFNKDSGSSVLIGDISREKDHVEVLLGVVDSTLDKDKEPILRFEDCDLVETDNSWKLDYFDGDGPWLKVSKWIDFIDPDGDPHHGRLTRCWDPDDPTDFDYYLEVDILSES